MLHGNRVDQHVDTGSTRVDRKVGRFLIQRVPLLKQAL